MQLVYLGLAWVGGIELAACLGLSPLWICVALLPFLAVLFVWYRDRRALFGALVLLVAVLGALRYDAAISSLRAERLDQLNFDARPRTLYGVVASDPEERGTQLRFRLALRWVQTGPERESLPGAVLVYAPGRPSIHYGDVVHVEGRLEPPPTFEGFDYREYLARQGISSVIYGARVRKTGIESGSTPLRLVYDLRHTLSSALSRALPTPEAELAQGLVLGGSRMLPAQVDEDLRRSGLSHLVAISGYNMSLVAGLVLGLAHRVLGRRPAALLAGASIALFAVFWGPQPSVLRAAAMAGLAILALYVGRLSFAPSALAFAVLVLSAFDPLILQDLGFQLSFAATAGILFLTPVLVAAFGAAWPRPAARGRPALLTLLAGATAEGAALTLGATLATLPITALNFQTVSLVAPLANLATLPAVPLAMLLAAAQAVLGLASPFLAQILAPASWLALHCIVKVAEAFSSLPVAVWNVGHLDAPVVALAYALLGALAVWGARVGHQTPDLGVPVRAAAVPKSPVAFLAQWGALGAVMLALALPWGALGPSAGLDRVTFLDVGQGDAVLIETAQGQTILIDGGPSEEALFRSLDSRLPFWRRTLDLVISTHLHQDHVEGLYGVVRRLHVGQVLDNPSATGAAAERWRSLLDQRSVPYLAAEPGTVIGLSAKSRLEILSARATTAPSLDEDLRSLMLRYSCGNVSFFLAGDVDAATALREMGESPPAAQVLKVPHHGARESLNAELLRTLAPAVAVISVGENNRYGHPSANTLALLADTLTLRTDRDGDVTFFTDGRGLWLATRR